MASHVQEAWDKLQLAVPQYWALLEKSIQQPGQINLSQTQCCLESFSTKLVSYFSLLSQQLFQTFTMAIQYSADSVLCPILTCSPHMALLSYAFGKTRNNFSTFIAPNQKDISNRTQCFLFSAEDCPPAAKV